MDDQVQLSWLGDQVEEFSVAASAAQPLARQSGEARLIGLEHGNGGVGGPVDDPPHRALAQEDGE